MSHVKHYCAMPVKSVELFVVFIHSRKLMLYWCHVGFTKEENYTRFENPQTFQRRESYVLVPAGNGLS